jgi:hypothetical protein
MRPVSDTFLATITGSHRMVSRARLCTPDQEGTNPGPLASNGEPLYPLAIEDGDVLLNPSAQIRSTAALTVLAQWPATEFDQLFPNGGSDLFLERGIERGDGSREWVSLGYHRLDKVKQRRAPDGPIAIDGSDRMSTIIDARLTEPRQYSASTTIRTVIEDLVLELFPAATLVLTGFDPDDQIGSDQICERYRYAFLNEIAKAQGCTLYFDYAGRFVMEPVPDYTSTDPVWTISHGDRGVLIDLAREISRESVFNAVVADGEHVGDTEPVHAVVRDLNPQSPTRWDGPFKQVPRYYASSFLRTEEQALRAADAMLRRSTGVPYVIDFNIVPNPALEPFDLVAVQYGASSRLEHHVLDTLKIPMIARRSMTGTTRIQPSSEVP